MDKKEMVNAINEAIYKALEDDNFKAKLLKDANEAVLELTGKKIPVKVTVHDTDEKNLVFILPKWNPEGELDEDNLEAVSGGVLHFGTRSFMDKLMIKYGGYFPNPQKNALNLNNETKFIKINKED